MQLCGYTQPREGDDVSGDAAQINVARIYGLKLGGMARKSTLLALADGMPTDLKTLAERTELPVVSLQWELDRLIALGLVDETTDGPPGAAFATRYQINGARLAHYVGDAA